MTDTLSESEVFWLLLLAELGIIILSDGMARLLAAGATVGTVYLGSKKELI